MENLVMLFFSRLSWPNAECLLLAWISWLPSSPCELSQMTDWVNYLRDVCLELGSCTTATRVIWGIYECISVD